MNTKDHPNIQDLEALKNSLMEDIELKGAYIANILKNKEQLEAEMVAHGVFNHIAVTLNKI